MSLWNKIFKKKSDEQEQKDLQTENVEIENTETELETKIEITEDEQIPPELELKQIKTDEAENNAITEDIKIQDSEIEENIKDEEFQNTETESEKKKGFFARLKDGLNKTRKNIINSIDNVLSAFTKIDEDLFEELEETLIMADIGVETTSKIIESLREAVKKQRINEPMQIKQLLIDEITKILEEDNTEFELTSPSIILVIGVNGVGKTTTIGKLANKYKSQGNKVLLAAADTFRAAAIDQLEVWGKRSNIDVIKHQENSDPAAVVYDALQAAKSRKTDILICDTAGRLHNKKNLMEELRKIFKVINREYPDAHKEVFLVLDGTTGQNGMQQAKVFKEVADITGIVITKLDGTAKGGIIIAIKSELKIPIRYIGIGEKIDDLQEFNAHDFAKALFED